MSQMKSRIAIEEGVPVYIRGNQKGRLKVIRIKVKKRGKRYTPLAKLDARSKKALQLYQEVGCDPKQKGAVGRAAGFKSDGNGNAVTCMNRLLARETIIKEMENKCQKKNKMGTDEKVAETIINGLDANHPLAKGEKKDWHAIAKFVKERNDIVGVYPPKKIDIEERKAVLHLTTKDAEALEKYDELTEGK